MKIPAILGILKLPHHRNSIIQNDIMLVGSRLQKVPINQIALPLMCRCKNGGVCCCTVERIIRRISSKQQQFWLLLIFYSCKGLPCPDFWCCTAIDESWQRFYPHVWNRAKCHAFISIFFILQNFFLAKFSIPIMAYWQCWMRARSEKTSRCDLICVCLLYS